MSSASTTRVRRTLPAAITCLTVSMIAGQAAFADYADVMQAGDTLFIQGDNGANTVVIVGAKETAGKLAVYIHTDPWIYEGVANIEIDLAGGDNELRMARINIAGDLTVVADDGANVVRLGGWKDYGTSFIQGDVSIALGGGDDQVQLENNWIGGNVNLETSAGADYLNIGAPWGYGVLGDINTLGNSILGDLTFSTGADNDFIWMMRSSVLGHTQISTAQGEDLVVLFDPELRRSRDQRKGRATTSNTFLGLTIDTGSEADAVDLKGNDFYMQTTIETGSGADHLNLIDSNRVNGPLNAHGGNGQDTLLDDPANYYAVPPVFNSFEL